MSGRSRKGGASGSGPGRDGPGSGRGGSGPGRGRPGPGNGGSGQQPPSAGKRAAPKSRSSQSQLSEADKRLWQGVADTVKPLHTNSFTRALDDLEAEALQSATKMRGSEARQTPFGKGAHGEAKGEAQGRPPAGVQLPSQAWPQGRSQGWHQGGGSQGGSKRRPGDEGHFLSAARQPQKIDRKIKTKIARGRIAIDRRLDLHGMTQSEAHQKLLIFVTAAFQRGERTLLVITGKGGRDGAFGVLRQSLPRWLMEPAFRPFVSGIEEASPGHGGAGAFYVRLKGGHSRN